MVKRVLPIIMCLLLLAVGVAAITNDEGGYVDPFGVYHDSAYGIMVYSANAAPGYYYNTPCDHLGTSFHFDRTEWVRQPISASRCRDSYYGFDIEQCSECGAERYFIDGIDKTSQVKIHRILPGTDWCYTCGWPNNTSIY